MTQDQIVEAVNEQIQWTQKIARNFSLRFKTDFDDLFSVAQESLLKACQTYDGDRGALTTHVHTVVSRDLSSYLRKAKSHQHQSIDKFAYALYRTIEDFDLADFVAPLSKDARTVTYMCMSISDMIWGEDLAPKFMRGKLRDFLKKSGWAHNRIYKTFKEIAERLRNQNDPISRKESVYESRLV